MLMPFSNSFISLYHELAALDAAAIFTLGREPFDDLAHGHLLEISIALVVVYGLSQRQFIRETNDLCGEHHFGVA